MGLDAAHWLLQYDLTGVLLGHALILAETMRRPVRLSDPAGQATLLLYARSHR